MVSFYRIIKLSFQNLSRNLWLSTVTIVIISLTLLIIALFVVSNQVLNLTINYIQEKMDVSIYLKDPIDINDVLKYEIQIKNISRSALIDFTFSDDLSDILAYANIEDAGGGKVSDNKISWSKINLNPGEVISKVYKLKIKPSDQWLVPREEPLKISYPPSLEVKKIVINDTKNKKVAVNPAFSEVAWNLAAKQEGLISDLKIDLSQSSQVKSVEYISKEKALSEFAKLHPSDISEYAYSQQSLLASLRVKVKDPNKVSEVKRIVEDKKYLPIIESTTFQGELNQQKLDRLLKLTNFARKGGIVISIIFISVSILIIFNTIRINIFTRANEIEIMKLVGASKSFIRGPFIVESLCYGLIAAILTIAITYPVIYWFIKIITSYYGGEGQTLISYLAKNFPAIVILEILAGILVGVFSSILALRKYLKL